MLKAREGQRSCARNPGELCGQAGGSFGEVLREPKDKHIPVQPGDDVRAGDPLQDGPANPHDILRVKATNFLIDEQIEK